MMTLMPILNAPSVANLLQLLVQVAFLVQPQVSVKGLKITTVQIFRTILMYIV
jgi:hypothetical protein